jgi:hypothetical protein
MFLEIIYLVLLLIRVIIGSKSISLGYFNFYKYISYLEYNLKEKFGHPFPGFESQGLRMNAFRGNKP